MHDSFSETSKVARMHEVDIVARLLDGFLNCTKLPVWGKKPTQFAMMITAAGQPNGSYTYHLRCLIDSCYLTGEAIASHAVAVG